MTPEANTGKKHLAATGVSQFEMDVPPSFANGIAVLSGTHTMRTYLVKEIGLRPVRELVPHTSV